ncbi:MAG: type IV pili twitching motility protein PilT, partial [Synergistaceae bacterium]
MEPFDLNALLVDGIKNSASDIHIGVGTPPSLRINGSLIRRPDMHPVTPDEMDWIMNSLLTKDQLDRFISEREYDFSFNLSHSGGSVQRFRGNFSFERSNPTLALRI